MKEGTNHNSFEQDTKRLTAQNAHEIHYIFVSSHRYQRDEILIEISWWRNPTWRAQHNILSCSFPNHNFSQLSFATSLCSSLQTNLIPEEDRRKDFATIAMLQLYVSVPLALGPWKISVTCTENIQNHCMNKFLRLVCWSVVWIHLSSAWCNTPGLGNVTYRWNRPLIISLKTTSSSS